METESIMDEQAPKKGRHRKKLLYNSILQQMEFYYSDSNLAKDRLLSQLMEEDPYVDISIFLKFNRIRKLTTNVADITKAVSKSNLIELSEDKTKIRRKEPVKIKENVDDCTIYVERLRSDATHDWLISTFSEFGNVAYVSIPKYKHNGMIKGFAFVEFETPEEAKASLDYFESIDCKIPSHIEPQKLCSIATFEGDKKNEFTSDKQNKDEQNTSNGNTNEPEACQTKQLKHGEATEDACEIKKEFNEINTTVNDEVSTNIITSSNNKDEGKKKRKMSDAVHENAVTEIEKEGNRKKIKLEPKEETNDEIQPEILFESDGEEKKKRKQKKSHKKKNNLKELGLQILSKKDWKKMRNHYLNMQRKTMKQLKMHLNRHKFSNNYEFPRKMQFDEQNSKMETAQENEFLSGIIVKLSLPEPCEDNKKLKNEIKACSSDVKFIDIPLPVGSEEVFIRFTEPKNAQTFCTSGFKGKASILEGDEEKSYWKKIDECRSAKQKRVAGKQRGRDKLLKKAEKQGAKHVRFDESE